MGLLFKFGQVVPKILQFIYVILHEKIGEKASIAAGKTKNQNGPMSKWTFLLIFLHI